MKISVLSFLATCTLAAPFALHAQQAVLPLWPHGTPEPAPSTLPEADLTTATDPLLSGHRTARLTNISTPTLSVYPPTSAANTGAAALVFPGGGYRFLAWEGEGLDTCTWLNSAGMTCLLVKYRVPQPDGEAGHFPADPADLEDAQQAMRLARAHATEWHIDPARIGAVGYSAGANLAVLLAQHPEDHHVESTPAARDVNAALPARPSFVIAVYPAYLAIPPDETALFPVYKPNVSTPPVFLVQAEDDAGYGRNAIVYYRALLDAHVPSELHYFATGGHGFGVFPKGKPEQSWTLLATTWLRLLQVLPTPTP